MTSRPNDPPRRLAALAAAVAVPVLLGAMPSGVMGAVAPRLAWLWAIVIGGGIFAAHAIARGLGFAPPHPPHHLAETLIALAPAFLGAYAGVAGRAVLDAGSSRL